MPKYLVGVVVIAALFVASMAVGRQAPDGGQVLHWTSGPTVESVIGDASRPTPVRAVSEPLGKPQPVPSEAGPYEFALTQPGSDTPVTYDPCRPIEYVVNSRTAFPGADRFLAKAMRRISEVTGLQFVAAGATDEVPSVDRNAFLPEQYGDRWAPVLIAWTDDAEVPDLAGRVAGVGGSIATSSSPGGPLANVSGIVALDGPQAQDRLSAPNGEELVAGLAVHELGHLVGLAHVEDPGQLMHASSGVTELQTGDLAGLARLGAGPCIPRL